MCIRFVASIYSFAIPCHSQRMMLPFYTTISQSFCWHFPFASKIRFLMSVSAIKQMYSPMCSPSLHSLFDYSMTEFCWEECRCADWLLDQYKCSTLVLIEMIFWLQKALPWNIEFRGDVSPNLIATSIVRSFRERNFFSLFCCYFVSEDELDFLSSSTIQKIPLEMHLICHLRNDGLSTRNWFPFLWLNGDMLPCQSANLTQDANQL